MLATTCRQGSACPRGSAAFRVAPCDCEHACLAAPCSSAPHHLPPAETSCLRAVLCCTVVVRRRPWRTPMAPRARHRSRSHLRRRPCSWRPRLPAWQSRCGCCEGAVRAGGRALWAGWLAGSPAVNHFQARTLAALRLPVATGNHCDRLLTRAGASLLPRCAGRLRRRRRCARRPQQVAEEAHAQEDEGGGCR